MKLDIDRLYAALVDHFPGRDLQYFALLSEKTAMIIVGDIYKGISIHKSSFKPNSYIMGYDQKTESLKDVYLGCGMYGIQNYYREVADIPNDFDEAFQLLKSTIENNDFDRVRTREFCINGSYDYEFPPHEQKRQ
jgi:hypothetical protein